MNDFILKTDSYKLTHWNHYPPGTRSIYSYFESRIGANFRYTVFYGLQGILEQHLVGRVIDSKDILVAKALSLEHFGSNDIFNEGAWLDILKEHNGRLPIEIKAVPEGTPVTTNNVLMTVRNTDPKHPWLTNYIESLLTHVWYPSTVATLSRCIKQDLSAWLDMTADNKNSLPFMLHDFGYRGVSSDESAAVGGSAHLVNFLGTDTLRAMTHAMTFYDAKLSGLGYSVPATEHSVMTAEGESGEERVVQRLLNHHNTGILSLVIDSYNPYRFVEQYICSRKEHIINRKPNQFGVAKVVLRPDSNTDIHARPGDQVVWILNKLANTFGSLVNSKGYVVVNPCVGVLWGDGIDRHGINDICSKVEQAGFSVESLVFGMGGGLLQKVNRDTQRFAFKCSAREDEHGWHNVFKKPQDLSKRSKQGRLKLVQKGTNYVTLSNDNDCLWPDKLETVFLNGEMVKRYNFDEVRKNAEL